MTPQSARTLSAVHAAQSSAVRATERKRVRKRERLKRALQRIKDEPLRISARWAARRGMKLPEDTARRVSKTSRASLMWGAAAMSVAAQGMVPNAASLVPEVAIQQIQSDNVRKHATQLTASDEFIEALAEEEGVRYTVYRDVAGYPTVGVGHLVLPEDGLRVGDTISHGQAMAFLKQDVAKAADGVRDLVGNLPLHQHEFDALVDLVFNVGAGNVSESESPKLNAAIDAADYDAIAGELHYHTAAGAKANGLVYRSERRSQIFLDGNYEDPREQAQKAERA